MRSSCCLATLQLLVKSGEMPKVKGEIGSIWILELQEWSGERELTRVQSPCQLHKDRSIYCDFPVEFSVVLLVSKKASLRNKLVAIVHPPNRFEVHCSF